MFRVPFSADEFFGVFVAYNEAVWPAQLVLLSLACGVAILAFRGNDRAARWIWAGLGALWLWTGVVYHILHFSVINPAAFGFGALFVVEGLLLFGRAAEREPPRFRFSVGIRGVSAAAMIAYALAIYPLVGALAGHAYRASPTFGAPCPLVIFTFGMLLLSPLAPRWLLVVPAVWAVLGLSAVFEFGVIQDLGLLLSALVAVPLMVRRPRSGGVGPPVQPSGTRPG